MADDMIVTRLQEGGEVWNHDPKYCSSIEIKYLVLNAEGKQAAIDGVLAQAPKTFGGLYLKSVQFDGYDGEGAILLSAIYSREQENMLPDDLKDNDRGFTFSITSGTMRRSVPLRRMKRIPKSAPDHDGINVNDQMEIEGVEVVKPIYTFTETHYIRGRKVDTRYKNTLARLFGCINNAPFRGYKGGEVLFLGADGSRKGIDRDDLWEITFKFAVQLTETDIAIGDLRLDRKVGWDYLWVNYGRKVVNGRVKTYAKAMYVDRVMHTADFGLLGIGVK